MLISIVQDTLITISCYKIPLSWQPAHVPAKQYYAPIVKQYYMYIATLIAMIKTKLKRFFESLKEPCLMRYEFCHKTTNPDRNGIQTGWSLSAHCLNNEHNSNPFLFKLSKTDVCFSFYLTIISFYRAYYLHEMSFILPYS